MGTPQYIKDAQNTYNAKFDLIQLKLPKGTKERIKRITNENMSMSEYCKQAVLSALERSESASDGKREKVYLTGAYAAPTSPGKEERKKISQEPESRENKANKTFIDGWDDMSEEEKSVALQAMIERKRMEIQEAREYMEPSGSMEDIEQEPELTAEKPDELSDKLKSIKAYRKQVKAEREKYGELSEEMIKQFIEGVEREGNDILSPEYQERIREAVGSVNLDRINEYLNSIGKMQD